MIKGSNHTEETKIKMRKNHKPQNTFLGRTHSEESKKKMRESHIGQVPWNKGRIYSDEERAKMSKAHLGKGIHICSDSEILQKILEHSHVNDNGCFVYPCKNRYPKVFLGNKKYSPVHKWVYIHCFGEIPNKKEVCHKCDNTHCWNPEHLFIGTHRENIQDASNKNRLGKCRKLTDEQVRSIRGDSRKNTVIAKEYGIDNGRVSRIKNRKIFKGVI